MADDGKQPDAMSNPIGGDGQRSGEGSNIEPRLAYNDLREWLVYAERLGDDQKAYDLALKARETLPDDPELGKTIGILLYRRGDYAGAARALQEGLRKRGDDGETLYYLGMAHFKLKENSESLSELQRALNLSLSDIEADDAKSTLNELKGNTSGPALSSQPIRYLYY